MICHIKRLLLLIALFYLTNSLSVEINQEFIAIIQTGQESDAIRFFIDNKAAIDINNQDKLGATALMHAAMNGWARLVSCLITHQAIVNMQDSFGRTALMHVMLHSFCEGDYSEVLKNLLDSKADVTLQDIHGQTVLNYPSEHTEINYILSTITS